MAGEVLLIEDSHSTRMIVQKILERQGYTLQTASDGPSGLSKIQEHKPRMVLLDISLPEMDGMEIARRVRAHEDEEIQKTVLIALTAMGTPRDRDRFYEAGCDDHLPKPFRAAQLVEIVTSYMSADFIPGETATPGGKRRQKLAEMQAFMAETALKEAGQNEPPEEPHAQTDQPAQPAPEAPAPATKIPPSKPAGHKQTKPQPPKEFSVRDDLLSSILDPDSVEPTDPDQE